MAETGAGPVAGRALRVLVVEDSPRLRARIADVLDADPAMEVVGRAGDGQAAIDRCLELRPDVVTMDVRLAGVNGLVVTEQLMQRCPTPILIISAATDRGELVNAFAALSAGAVDVLEKPGPGADGPDWDRRLLAAVRMVARIRVITHFGARRGSPPPVPSPPAPASSSPTSSVPPSSRPPSSPPPSSVPPSSPGPWSSSARLSAAPALSSAAPALDGPVSVVAIGASTGGPAALATVLCGLPRSFDLPVLVVLHVSDSFGPAIASWLKGVTGRPVRLAASGESLAALGGQVVMAPPGRHLVVRGGLLALTHDPERHSCRPSVDVLFESLAREAGPRVAACLLTGMGRDGATGLLEVHRAGGLTIAQDEASSVVHGMPGEAVRLGAAQQVLPVEAIGPALGRLTGSGVSR